MQQVKNIVKGPYEPQDNTVMWIDTSNPDAPIAKVHSNGEWKAVSGVDNLPTVLNEIVDKVTDLSANSIIIPDIFEEIQFEHKTRDEAKTILGISEEELIALCTHFTTITVRKEYDGRHLVFIGSPYLEDTAYINEVVFMKFNASGELSSVATLVCEITNGGESWMLYSY